MNAIVYCDLDGVLADFRGAIDELLGPDTAEYRRITGPEWKHIQQTWPTFWSDLDYEDHALDLWRTIAPYHPSILTAIPDGWPSAGVGKTIWVRRKLPKFGYHPSQQVHAVLRSEKKQFARQPDGTANVLIDDTKKNVDEWSAAGGVAIHYIPTKSMVTAVGQTLKKLF